MSSRTRAARGDEIDRLWPAVAAGHAFATKDEFVRFHEQGAWRVRVNEDGDAYVLRVWRSHSDVAALQGLWAPPRRVSALIADARAVAAARGLRRVMSPLVTVRASGVYLESGMAVFERLVAYSLSLAGPGVRSAAALPVVRATREDVETLAALDRACFEEFWRHGPEELYDALAEGAHVTLVRDETGGVAGSAVSAQSGSVVTIGRLATAPSARRRGVASALLADACEWACSRGALGLSLCTQEANGPARRLYSATGFDQAPDAYVLLMTPVS